MGLRIKNLYPELEKSSLDALIIFHPANITYLTGYQSRDSCLLVSRKKNLYLTDSRYIEEAKNNLRRAVTVRRTDAAVPESIADACSELGLKRIGFDEKRLSFALYKKIKNKLRKGQRLVPAEGLIEEMRLIKEPVEIRYIKKAISITGSALKFAQKSMRQGMKEIEVVGELERFIRYQGAGNAAFEIIVASGPNSSFPHHIPGQRKLKSNEPVLIDIGVDYRGYKSDLTRVFFLGKMNALAHKIYRIVLEAQERAIKKIKPAAEISEVDAAARQYITQKGFDRFFGHNLGHGIGLEVHEGPSISGKEKTALQPGMVFTVEPAIYLPKKFGIRIEDIVLVTDKGCEVISGAVNK